jgi:hypothetical protein
MSKKEDNKDKDKLREDSARHWGYTLVSGWPTWCPDWDYPANRQTRLSNEYDKNTLCKLL